MTILDKIRALLAAVDLPRPVQAVAAGAAITWGTTVAARIAEQCGDEISTADARLGELEATLVGREVQLAAVRAAILEGEVQLEQMRTGRMDAVVFARAAARGWGPPVDVDQLVEYATRDADSVGIAATTAAAIRFYFSAGGPGAGLPELPDVDGGDLVDEPDVERADHGD